MHGKLLWQVGNADRNSTYYRVYYELGPKSQISPTNLTNLNLNLLQLYELGPDYRKSGPGVDLSRHRAQTKQSQ